MPAKALVGEYEDAKTHPTIKALRRLEKEAVERYLQHREKASAVHRLHDVEKREHFAEYYAANNLTTIDDKINNLTCVMKIRATRSDEKETKDEELAGLEELALLGYWRASW